MLMDVERMMADRAEKYCADRWGRIPQRHNLGGSSGDSWAVNPSLKDPAEDKQRKGRASGWLDDCVIAQAAGLRGRLPSYLHRLRR